MLSDLEGRWLSVNHHFCQMLGYSQPELLQKDTASVTHPEERALGAALRKQLVDTGQDRYTWKNAICTATARQCGPTSPPA